MSFLMRQAWPSSASQQKWGDSQDSWQGLLLLLWWCVDEVFCVRIDAMLKLMDFLKNWFKVKWFKYLSLISRLSGFGYFFVLEDVRSSASIPSRWCLDRSKRWKKLRKRKTENQHLGLALCRVNQKVFLSPFWDLTCPLWFSTHSYPFEERDGREGGSN